MRTNLPNVVRYSLPDNLSDAVAALKETPEEGLSGFDRQFRNDFLTRFCGGNHGISGQDDFLSGILHAYRAYWFKLLLGECDSCVAEDELRRALSRLAAIESFEVSMDDLEEKLKNELLARGVHSLFGRTLPFREFMAWRSERCEKCSVELIDSSHEIDLVYLDDFLSLGWFGYATLDHIHTGGWAKDNAIFCVVPAWNMESETFRISFLCHEVQHISDYQLKPELQGPELEYRAKLVELAFAEQTSADLIRQFVSDANEGRDVPHKHAAFHVVQNLKRYFGLQDTGYLLNFPVESIQVAARELFVQSNYALSL